MFGISPLGWLHTLGSLPAIPAAAYMLFRHGRIVPRSTPGSVYFVSMLIGGITVIPIAHQAAGTVIAIVTILLLLAGYGIGRFGKPGRAGVYVETICLSLTTFLLMLPTVTEILRRVPEGHPLAQNVNSPLLVGAQAFLLVALIVGLTGQMIWLRRQGRAAASQAL